MGADRQGAPRLEQSHAPQSADRANAAPSRSRAVGIRAAPARPARPRASRPPAAALVVLLALAGLPALLPWGEGRPVVATDTAYAAEGAPCGGEPMPAPSRVIEGEFGPELAGGYVMVPFRVPRGTTAVRVKYCHDQPLISTPLTSHTLDMGVYGPLPRGKRLWTMRDLRGWGGSSRKDVTISPRAVRREEPRAGRKDTTVGYRPGPVDPGRWAVELGVAAFGDEVPTEDGAIKWRVEIDLIDDPSYATPRYREVAYDESPALSEPGWYAGDFHVHARHSNPNDASMEETFDYAFAPPGEGAGLDFITLSDYNTDRAWGEIGRFQDDHPGKLIVRSAEAITYRGHVNNHASGRMVDYRTGPIWLRRADGSVELLRTERPASRILRQIRNAGGVNQLNHVETFPSEVPTFSRLCRGCSWDYSDEETEYSLVDAIEVATGPAGLDLGAVKPGPNPFALLAVLFYEAALDADGKNSHKIAAVGSSDSHNAGRTPDPVTQAPIGQATTMVRARELSERGIKQAVRKRRTYVKLWGADGPDVRLRGSLPGQRSKPIGSVLRGEGAASFSARILGLDRSREARPGIYTALVLKDGLPIRVEPLLGSGDEHVIAFDSQGPGRYSIAILRETALETYTSPIWLERP